MPEQPHKETTHGSPELDEDARKLEALGADPGPTFAGLGLDPEPDRDANYYEWLKWWYRQPEHQERAREIESAYIAEMQKDKNLD